MNKLIIGLFLILSFSSQANALSNIPYPEAMKSQVRMTSGLGISIIKNGVGKKPKPTDKVTVHYEGKFLNGKVFDSSYKRGVPATFALNRVISGWTEGLQYMNTGAKFRFVIPAHLAYGQRGVPGTVPPNTTLIFTVELISIN